MPTVWQYWAAWSKKFVRPSRSYAEQIFCENCPRLANPSILGVRFLDVMSITINPEDSNMRTWQEIQKGEGHQDPSHPEPEVQDQIAGEKQEVSTALVPIEKMLPGFRVSTNALVVHQQRKELYDNIVFGYCAAHRHLKELQVAVEKQQKISENQAQQAQIAGEEKPTTALVLLTKKRHEIALMHGQDALELVRNQLGLDTVRGELLEELRSKLSPERGLEMLSAWTKAILKKECATIREANELFPHLTLSELAFFPLLEQLPLSMMLFGTTFDAISLANQVGWEEEAHASMQRRIPQQVWATVQGLAYVLDTYIPENQDKGILECDPYSILGLTGVNKGVELVEFTVKIKRIVQQLVPLLMSNSRLYEKVWTNSPESLQVGFGRIARVALEKTCGEDGKDAASVSLSAAIDLLNAEQKVRFNNERQCLEQTIVRASVYDLARDVMLRVDEVVKLCGILNHVPLCLMQEQPFTGFIKPFGVCVNFIAPDGKIIETCPFSPVHGRDAVETLHAESQDSGRENRTIAFLFRELFMSVQGNVMDKGVEDVQNLSLLEATALQLWVERHVVLQPLPAWSLVQVHDWSKDLLSYTVTGKDVVTRLTSKIGVQEAQQIVMTLSIPDAKLLERVKRVVKVQNVHSLAAMTEGMAIEGTYEAGSGTITLMEFLEMLYGDVTPMKKAVRSFTLLHECGEAVWTMLQESDKEQWKKVSWPRTARKKVEKHFLTFYAHHKDEKEDFCDHFAAYILHGPEFRMATASARPLKRKYRLLRSIIATLTGVSSEFPCFIPWTIREIQGALEQEIEHMELKDAIELEEKKAADSYLDNQERIFEIRKSFEQLVAQDERKSNAQDAEDPDDRKAAEQEEEDEDEEYENPIQEEEGLIEVHEIRAKVTDVLESIMDPEELEFRSLRRKVVDCLLDGDWEGVEDALDFLDKEDKEETMDLLYEIDAGPQRPC